MSNDPNPTQPKMIPENERSADLQYYYRNKEKIRERRVARYRANKEKFKALNRKNYIENRARILGYKRKHRLANAEKYALRARLKRAAATEPPSNYLLRNYGITKAQYDSMFLAQSGVCKICGLPEKQKRRLAMGLFRDSIELLQKAIDYLKTYESDVQV